MAPRASSSFEKLLSDLRALHEKEINALRSEVSMLQTMRRADNEALSRAGGGSASTTPPPPSPVNMHEKEDNQHKKEDNQRSALGSSTSPPPQAQVDDVEEFVEVAFLPPKRRKPPDSRLAKTDDASLSPLTSRLKAFLSSDKYELAVVSIIMANIGVMAADAQYQGIGIGHDLGYRWFDSTAEDAWPGGLTVITVLDYFFLSLFTIDLAMCLTVLKLSFFRSSFNWLDLIVVATGWVEVVSSFLPIPPTLMRMLRLLKFGRALRAVQLSRVSQSLKMLRICIMSSFEMLFWSLCLLGLIQCVGGMIISVLVRPYLENHDFDLDKRKQVFRYYGTFSSTTLSMFETLFANWATPCRVLVDNVSEWYSLWFIFYRCLIGFAVLNVVNACFVQRTMAVGQQDTEIMIDMKEREQERYAHKLKALFNELDSSGDGLLEWGEFCQLATDGRLRAYMGALDIGWSDLAHLFEVMSNGTGYISIADFTTSACRVRGAAKGIDMANLLGICRRVEDLLQIVSDNSSCGPGGRMSARVEGARRRESLRNSLLGIGMPGGAFFRGGAVDKDKDNTAAPSESGPGVPSRQIHFDAGESTQSVSQSSSPAAPPASTRGGETAGVRIVDVESRDPQKSIAGSASEDNISNGWANEGEQKPVQVALRQELSTSLEEASANGRQEVPKSRPEDQFRSSDSEDGQFNV